METTIAKYQEIVAKTNAPLKRPTLRVKEPYRKVPLPTKETNALLYDILQKKYTPPKRPKKIQYYKSESYIRDLERNNKNLNIPFKRPEVVESPPWTIKKNKYEPTVKYLNHIKMELNVEGENVKVNLVWCMYDLNEKYYAHFKTPSHKRIISAYREYGFSEEYINRIKKNLLKTKQICDNFDMIKAFGATKITKQTKKPEPEPTEEESDQEMSDIDEDEPEEDGGFDVDEMNDEPEEDVDEGYFSDDA